jgi:ATP-dependent Zn protease
MARQNRYNPNTKAKVNSLDPNDPRLIAMHESGHAVAAVLLGIEVRGVDLKQRFLADGRVSVGFTNTAGVAVKDLAGAGEEVAMPFLIQTMAGPIAEMSMAGFPQDLAYGMDHDFEQIRKMIALTLCEGESSGETLVILPAEMEAKQDVIKRVYETIHARTLDLVQANLPAIRAVADALRTRIELTGNEVREIVNAYRTEVV